MQKLLSQGQEPASNENLKIYDPDPERIFTIWSKVSEPRQIEELRQNGVTIKIILDADYLHVERNSYGFCVVLVRKRLETLSILVWNRV